MCHDDQLASFPPPGEFGSMSDEVEAFVIGNESAGKRLAIIPDIYGCNPFYRGFATHLANKGSRVYLVNPFAGLGELAEATREAAFERRHKISDRDFVDRFVAFHQKNGVTGVIGFCIGGLFVFELARRELTGDLLSFYPFPQGLQNQDPLPIPFDYLDSIKTPNTVLLGDQDALLGPENVERMRIVAEQNESIDLHLYAGSGHGFLGDLDSSDAHLRDNAQDALAVCERVVL